MNCERAAACGAGHCGRFQLLIRPGQGAVVINALSGAWLGGDEAEIRSVFKYLQGGTPQVQLAAHLQDLIQGSSIAEPPIVATGFEPELAVLHVGHTCNLSCEYCYAPKDQARMSPEIIDATCRFLAQVPRGLFIQFMGGEPLLHLREIGGIVDKLREGRSQFPTSCGIQTNGFHLLDEGVLSFLQARDIYFGLSFDGPRGMSAARFGARTDELQRQVEDLIERLHECDIQFGVLAVLNRYNAHRLEELLDWCLNRGIPRLLLTPVLPQPDNRELAVDEGEAAEALRSLFRIWVDRGLYRKIEIENFRSLEDNLTDLHRGYMCRKYPCGAGREQVAINTDGWIYPCDYLTGLAQFALGHVSLHTPADIAGSGLLLRLHEQTALARLGDCGTCGFLSICGHCVGSSYFNGGGVAGKRLSCQSDKLVIEEMLFELLWNSEYSSHVVSR